MGGLFLFSRYFIDVQRRTQMSPMLTKDLVASTRVTYPHHWPRRRRPLAEHLVLFEHGYRHCSRLLEIEGQTSTGRTRSSTYLEAKLSFESTPPLKHARGRRCGCHCTCMYYMCMRSYKKFSDGGVKKVCGRPFKMRSVGLVETETFFGVALLLFLTQHPLFFLC